MENIAATPQQTPEEAERARLLEKLRGMPTDQKIGLYISLRDELKAVELAHKEKTLKAKNVMALIENVLQDELNEAGENSKKTDAGTCFKKKHKKITIRNWQETLDWIREKEQWGLLTKKLADREVFNFLEDEDNEGVVIPGIGTRIDTVINIQKPRNKS